MQSHKQKVLYVTFTILLGEQAFHQHQLPYCKWKCISTGHISPTGMLAGRSEQPCTQQWLHQDPPTQVSWWGRRDQMGKAQEAGKGRWNGAATGTREKKEMGSRKGVSLVAVTSSKSPFLDLMLWPGSRQNCASNFFWQRSK